jgi:uncharacterized protein YpmS
MNDYEKEKDKSTNKYSWLILFNILFLICVIIIVLLIVYKKKEKKVGEDKAVLILCEEDCNNLKNTEIFRKRKIIDDL